MSARTLARTLGLAAAALLFADEAQVSQVHYMAEPLSSVIDFVELVVVAKLADPPYRSEAVTYPITLANGQRRQGSYGVYLQRIQVSEVLHPPGVEAPKEVLEVYTPELVSGLDSQLLYEVDGVMESPIYTQLEGGIYPGAPEHAAGAIYLLRKPPAYGPSQDNPEAFAALYKAIAGAYPMAVGNSVLPLDQREALLRLLQQPRP